MTGTKVSAGMPAAQEANLGIGVGSSAATFSPGSTDYGAEITSMVQSAQVASAVFSSGANRRYLLTQSFTNLTGGLLTIREVGIDAETAGKISNFVVDTNKAYLAARQVVADFPVPEGSVAIVEFKTQI